MIVSISANYFLYRLGGTWRRFRRQGFRLLVFVAGAGLLWLVVPATVTDASRVRWTLILLWCFIRLLEEAKHKNILRLVKDGFRAGDPPAARHNETRNEE